MNIVSWPSGVNRIILRETSTSVGENAIQSEGTDNGSDQSVLKSSGAPDVFSVSMYFSNSRQDSFYNNHTDRNGNHVTEWEAFLEWFKGTALMGQNPFYFHKIDDPTEGRTCVYKIKSNGLPKGTPEGMYYKVTMTWVEHFIDSIAYVEDEPVVDSILVTNGQIDLRLTDRPSTPPVKASFEGSTSDYYDDPEDFVITHADYDGFKSCVLYFDAFTIPGIYVVNINYMGKVIAGSIIVTDEENM